MACSMFGVPWANCHSTANLHGSEEEKLWQQCTAHVDSAHNLVALAMCCVLWFGLSLPNFGLEHVSVISVPLAAPQV